MIYKLNILCVYLLITTAAAAQQATYKELYRPRFHFSPAVNWTNDPNGLVYFKNQYHLFYQHNPFGNVWGHMSWGHAVSNDAIHWKHLPLAIPEERDTMIFSGTCVYDAKNTSGLGTTSHPPLVAIYTGHVEGKNQSQCVAYSNDEGIHWTKYPANPILDLHKKDFRDPKVFWYEPLKYWVMALMYPVEHEVHFYSSDNLLRWKELSHFGPAGDTSGVWECPDLSRVPVENESGTYKWVLQTSQNASMQYFVGEFNGVTFTPESTETTVMRPDYGLDYYAAITYNQLPAASKPLAIGWVNNWNYANAIPTSPWKSAMSIPRELTVRKEKGKWVLLQQPVASMRSLRLPPYHFDTKNISEKEQLLGFTSKQCEIEFVIRPGTTNKSGIRIAAGLGHELEIGYDAWKGVLYLDRGKTAVQDFSPEFSRLHLAEAPVQLKEGKLRVRIFYDNSIAEVFVNDGEQVFTMQLFNSKREDQLVLFSHGGSSVFESFKAWPLRSAW